MSKLQTGIPAYARAARSRRANGLLLRGIVVATYVTDDALHPQAEAPEPQAAIAVYCDVLLFPSLPGERWSGLKNVLVSQEISGMHRGRIWKPRAASIDWLDQLNLPEGSNPASCDGDHVLVGFLNDNLSQPLILRSLPHPSTDLGREDKELGRRQKLKVADGDPDFFRHHGVQWGVSDQGNFQVNTTFANDGSLQANGHEQPSPTTAGKGDVLFDVPLEAKQEVRVNDMVDPDNPDPKAIGTLLKDRRTWQIKDAAGYWNLSVDSGATLKAELKDGAAKCTIGDGAMSVTVAEHLQTLYNLLSTEISKFNSHVHTSTPPGDPTTNPTVATPPTTMTPPAWDPNIQSDKLKIPDTG